MPSSNFGDSWMPPPEMTVRLPTGYSISLPVSTTRRPSDMSTIPSSFRSSSHTHYWPSAAELENGRGGSGDRGPLEENYFERLRRSRQTLATQLIQSQSRQHSPSSQPPQDSQPFPEAPYSQHPESDYPGWKLSWTDPNIGPFPSTMSTQAHSSAMQGSDRFSQLLSAKFSSESSNSSSDQMSAPQSRNSQYNSLAPAPISQSPWAQMSNSMEMVKREPGTQNVQLPYNPNCPLDQVGIQDLPKWIFPNSHPGSDAQPAQATHLVDVDITTLKPMPEQRNMEQNQQMHPPYSTPNYPPRIVTTEPDGYHPPYRYSGHMSSNSWSPAQESSWSVKQEYPSEQRPQTSPIMPMQNERGQDSGDYLWPPNSSNIPGGGNLQPQPMFQNMPWRTPDLTHRSSESIDSSAISPMTPQPPSYPLPPLSNPNHYHQSQNQGASTSYAPPNGSSPYPILNMFSTEGVPNGDMTGSYIGVGRNRQDGSASGSGANGHGNGDDEGYGQNNGDDFGGFGGGPGGGGDGGNDGGDGGDENGDEDGGNGDGQGDTPRRAKRTKLPLACHFCRRRKLKCDGVRPACDNCTKRGVTCTFDDHVRRRGPGKRTKEQRDKAAREAQEAGLTNDQSAGPSNPDQIPTLGINDTANGVPNHASTSDEYASAGNGEIMEAMEAMEAMGAVMGAELDLNIAEHDGDDLHEHGGVEGIGIHRDHLDVTQHNDLDFDPELTGEPSTLAEVGILDPMLRQLEHDGTTQENGNGIEKLGGQTLGKRKDEEHGSGDGTAFLDVGEVDVKRLKTDDDKNGITY